MSTSFFVNNTDSTKRTFTQASHGWSIGNCLYYTGSTWALAKADTETTAECLGIVSYINDANNFTLITEGYISGLSGLTTGSVHYLSASTAGALTATEPSSYGYISKPMLVALSTTTGIVLQHRGSIVGNPTMYNRWSGIGNGATTTLSVSGASNTDSKAYLVTLDGFLQDPSNYSVASGVMTFTTAPPNLTAIVVIERTSTTVTYTRWTGTGNAVTTAFTTTGISTSDPKALLVTFDGVVQDPANYTISVSGATVTFSTAPPNGTVIVMVQQSTGAILTPLTSKGDIFVFSTVNDRLAVGTNGQVLVADSTAATGIKWATGGKCIQRVSNELTTTASVTTTIPLDNTIPQSSEGTEIITCSITPTSTGNKLRISFTTYCIVSSTLTPAVTLFRNSETDALKTMLMATCPGANYAIAINCTFEVTPASTSSETYKIRMGPNAAGTIYVNQLNTGALYSTTDTILMEIMEIAP